MLQFELTHNDHDLLTDEEWAKVKSLAQELNQEILHGNLNVMNNNEINLFQVIADLFKSNITNPHLTKSAVNSHIAYIYYWLVHNRFIKFCFDGTKEACFKFDVIIAYAMGQAVDWPKGCYYQSSLFDIPQALDVMNRYVGWKGCRIGLQHCYPGVVFGIIHGICHEIRHEKSTESIKGLLLCLAYVVPNSIEFTHGVTAPIISQCE